MINRNKNDKGYETLALKIKPDLKQKVQDFADNEGLSMSMLVRIALIAYMNKNKKEE